MIQHRARALLIYIVGILLLLFSCKFPDRLYRTISQTNITASATFVIVKTESTPHSPETSHPNKTYIITSPTSMDHLGYPRPNDSAQPQVSSQANQYPGSDITPQPLISTADQYPAASPSNPDEYIQSVTPTQTREAYPASVSITPPRNSSTTASQTMSSTTRVPTHDEAKSRTPSLQTVSIQPYPNPGSTSEGAPTIGGGYPGPGETPSNHTPTPTTKIPSIGVSTPTITVSRRPTNLSPTVGPSRSHMETATPTLTDTIFFIPTATPTPTKTRFLTPTLTTTPTPTITRTPLPFPPWISSKLIATNPEIVRLASGRVQLVEFFAYWSGPSQAMAPLVLGLEKEYRGRIYFIYLDIDNPANKFFLSQLLFRIEPQFSLIDAQGAIIKQWVGYVTVEQFRDAFEAVLR